MLRMSCLHRMKHSMLASCDERVERVNGDG
jgi:hypothetical protein